MNTPSESRCKIPDLHFLVLKGLPRPVMGKVKCFKTLKMSEPQILVQPLFPLCKIIPGASGQGGRAAFFKDKKSGVAQWIEHQPAN